MDAQVLDDGAGLSEGLPRAYAQLMCSGIDCIQLGFPIQRRRWCIARHDGSRRLDLFEGAAKASSRNSLRMRLWTMRLWTIHCLGLHSLQCQLTEQMGQ